MIKIIPQKNGQITLAEVCDRLEPLGALGVTVRDGDARRLKG
jgi:hypothetical protein